MPVTGRRRIKDLLRAGGWGLRAALRRGCTGQRGQQAGEGEGGQGKATTVWHVNPGT